MVRVENQYIEFWKEGGILFSSYKIPFEMTLENSKEIYALREQISDGEPQYFCYDITNLKSMSLEARKYGEIHGQEHLIASAVIVNSLLTKFIYSIFLNLYKVKIPTKAFDSREEGVKWLKSLKHK